MPDGLAYFYYWLQPLNGPAGKEGGPLVAPVPGLRRAQERRSWTRPATRSRGWRTFRSTTVMPTGRSLTPTPRSTGRAARSRNGSPETWTAAKGRDHGDSSASINPASTRRRSTSTSSRCGSWPPYSRQEKSTSSLAAMFTTTSDRIRCNSPLRPRVAAPRASGHSEKVASCRWQVDARQEVQRPDRHDPQRCHLPDHRRRRTASVQSRAAGRPRIVAGIYI